MPWLKWSGILLIVTSIAVCGYAWKGKQPGGVTIEQQWIDGQWKTTRYDDESVPVRWTYTYSAIGIFLVGAGAIVASTLSTRKNNRLSQIRPE